MPMSTLPFKLPADLDCGAQPGQTGAEDHDVVMKLAVHCANAASVEP